MPAIFHIARFTILEAWRTHFALLLLMVIIAGVGLSAFMTSQAITETETIRISILAASLRLLSVFVLSIYVISSFVREINDKGMELTLALPITRAQYLFGKFTGFGLLAFISATTAGLCVWFFAASGEVLYWSLSLFAECLIMTALCLVCVLSFSQMVSAISAVFAVYLLSRSITAIRLMSEGPLVDLTSTWTHFIAYVVKFISVILPDLSLFTRTEWLLTLPAARQNFSIDVGLISVQSMLYISLLLAIGLFDLYRKNLDS